MKDIIRVDPAVIGQDFTVEPIIKNGEWISVGIFRKSPIKKCVEEGNENNLPKRNV